VATFHFRRWDEPPPAILHQDKQEVTPLGVELLHGPVPTLIPARGRQLHCEVIGRAVATTRRLDLHTEQAFTDIGDQVIVGTVKQRERNGCTQPSQPIDGRRFSNVPLPSRMESSWHENEHMFVDSTNGARSATKV
jgi:hypothetical protein